MGQTQKEIEQRTNPTSLFFGTTSLAWVSSKKVKDFSANMLVRCCAVYTHQGTKHDYIKKNV